MIKSRKIVDEEAVKAEIKAQTDWEGFCSVCGRKIVGTLEQLRNHGACHSGKQG